MLFLLLSHVCRHSHVFTSYPHQTLYAVDMVFLYFPGQKSRVFLPLPRVYHTKPAFAGHISCVRCVLSSPFSSFFSLLNPPCRHICHMSVSGVCCPRAVQAGKWGEGQRSGAGSLRLFSCQSHKPSKYPTVELGMTLG